MDHQCENTGTCFHGVAVYTEVETHLRLLLASRRKLSSSGMLRSTSSASHLYENLGKSVSKTPTTRHTASTSPVELSLRPRCWTCREWVHGSRHMARAVSTGDSIVQDQRSEVVSSVWTSKGRGFTNAALHHMVAVDQKGVSLLHTLMASSSPSQLTAR